MPKYQMVIAYDGTEYGDWQVQKNCTSVQSLIQNALSTIVRNPTHVTGSGRTDAGVHALGQVAHFELPAMGEDLNKMHASLNGILPKDIRILAIEPAEESFHARYSATSKIYHYRLNLSKIPNPFDRKYAYRVPHCVDVELLKRAASHFIGTHDFTSFANAPNQGAVAKGGVRTLYRLDVIAEEEGVRLEFEGNGFLYKMVRNITGTLLDVCAGKIALESLPLILAAKDRKAAGRTAPAHGLYLVKVSYTQIPC